MALIADRGRTDVIFLPSKSAAEPLSKLESPLLLEAVHLRLGLFWESTEDCKIQTECRI